MHALVGDAVDVGGPIAHQAVAVALMLRLPMSSPQMTTMFGFFAHWLAFRGRSPDALAPGPAETGARIWRP